MEIKVEVSVLIPSRNRPDALARCLTSIATQDYLVREVIIGDDASSPPVTLSNLQQLIDRTPVRIVRSDRPIGVIGMRLRLIQESKTPLIVFFDDDVTLPEPDTIRRLAGILMGSESTGLVAPVVIDHVGGREVCLGPIAIDRMHPTEVEELGGFVGAAFAIRKEALGLDVPFVTAGYGHEEIEIGFRIVDSGQLMVCDPTIIVNHYRASASNGTDESDLRFRFAVGNRLRLARAYLPQPYRMVHLAFWVVRYLFMALGRRRVPEYLDGVRYGLGSTVDRSLQLREIAVSYLRRNRGRLWF